MTRTSRLRHAIRAMTALCVAVAASSCGESTPLATDGVHYHAINQYGFLHVEVSGGSLTGTFYDENGQLLYERTVTKLDDTES